MQQRPGILLLAFFATLFFSCSSEKSDFVPKETAGAYYPVQTGKYITYRLDSTVFVRSGSAMEVHSYQVKHHIETETTDNLGRKTFRVRRTIRNAQGTDAWKENGFYYITPTAGGIEVIEDNMRVIKLENPLLVGNSWKGNAYLPDNPYATLYDMQAGQKINEWNFEYKQIADENIEGKSFTGVLEVFQHDEVLNMPPVAGTFGSKEVGLEKYARGIGMVYKNLEVYDYQPGHSDNGHQPTFSGFGITMWAIDHN